MTGKAEKAMTTRELAEYLNVPVRTIEDWRYGRGAGGPTFHYVGQQVRYWPADVKRWLQKQRRAS